MSQFPQVIDSWIEKIDKSLVGAGVTDEAITVPSSSPYEVYLDHIPWDADSTEIWTGLVKTGTEFTEVTTGTPTTSQFLVDYTTGKITFSSLDAGQAVYCSYKTPGDTFLAADINALQTAINDVQNALGTVPGGTQETGILSGIIDSSGVIKGTVDLGVTTGDWIHVPGYIKNFSRADGAVNIGQLSDVADLIVSHDLWVANAVYPSFVHASGTLRIDSDVKLGDSQTDSVEIVGAITNPSGNVQVDDVLGVGNNSIPAALRMYDTGTSTYKTATLVSGTLVWS